MNHNLTWEQAAALAAGLAGAAAVLRAVSALRGARRTGRVRTAAAGMLLQEAALVVALYALWQWVGSVARRSTAGAVDHGEGVLAVEDAAGLPSEHTVQDWILPHPVVTEALNLYYATAHFAAMVAMLIWVFVRHRGAYGPVRTTVAAATAACFVISLIAVAPPRLLPGSGFVDTAAEYGQSVYKAAGGLSPNEVAAMPSVHVAWAFLVACAVWRLGGRGWRWLGPAHLALTVFAVVATANHYWLDGIVAVVVVAVCGLAVGVLYTLAGRKRRKRLRSRSGRPRPVTGPGAVACPRPADPCRPRAADRSAAGAQSSTQP